MKRHLITCVVLCLAGPLFPAAAAELTLQSAPPVVVKTVPTAGDDSVDPALTEIKVTFSKPMQDNSWSWSTWGEENYPETTGKPNYLADHKTCVLPVKLKPNKFYAIWLNSNNFRNFKDSTQKPAVPYLLTFKTGPGKEAKAALPGPASQKPEPLDQVVANPR